MERKAPTSPLALAGVVFAVAGLALVMRVLDFGHGMLVGAMPAAGLALAAGFRLGVPGALAAGFGFVVCGLGLGASPIPVLSFGAGQAAAAALGGAALRALSRRRSGRSHTSDLMVFYGGAAVFILVSGTAVVLALLLTRAHPAGAPAATVARFAAFELLGLITAFPVIAHAREWRQVVADPAPALRTLAIAVALILALAVALRLTDWEFTSGATLVFSTPFCFWVAMQRRTLDGAAIALVASHVVLYLVLRDVGGDPLHPAYLLTTLYLNTLIATSQLVHTVNRDRLAALEEVAAQRTELERRVEQRTARLSAMTERALAADAAKTRFLATVSHEVRTPLNGVIGMASVVLAAPLEPGVRTNVEVIRRSGFHLLDVINRILDYSRLEGGGAEEETSFDLRALVDEVVAEARFLPFAEGVLIRVDMAEGASRRHGSRQGLRQVLTNLVGNALKFTDDGCVTLRVADTADGGVRVEVEDTGIGVPAEARERIFEPYEQVNRSATRRHGGTGLGLAISAEIIARMGGRIGLDSEEGRGSRFWFEVPLRVAAGQPARAGIALRD